MPSVTWVEPDQPATAYAECVVTVPASSLVVTLFGPWMPIPIVAGVDGWAACEVPVTPYVEGTGTPVPWTEKTL